MDHSGSQELQANSDGNPHGRSIGDRGEFGPQIGADGGRKWQMRENGAEFGPQSDPGDGRAGCLTETRKAAARTGTTPKTGAPTIAYSVKPARTPPQNRAESPKTIPKTVRKTVETSNKGPNFRMVGAYATPFLFD